MKLVPGNDVAGEACSRPRRPRGKRDNGAIVGKRAARQFTEGKQEGGVGRERRGGSGVKKWPPCCGLSNSQLCSPYLLLRRKLKCQSVGAPRLDDSGCCLRCSCLPRLPRRSDPSGAERQAERGRRSCERRDGCSDAGSVEGSRPLQQTAFICPRRQSSSHLGAIPGFSSFVLHFCH